jgi:ankyrin repeat protein
VLMVAAGAGHSATVRFLIDAGADVKAVDESGHSALSAAASKGYGVIVRLLLAKDAPARQSAQDGMTPLHASAIGCFDGAMRDLIKAGADVNAANLQGKTPLMLAAAGQCVEPGLRQLFVPELRADIRDTAGRSALWHAADQGNLDMIKALLATGLGGRRG